MSKIPGVSVCIVYGTNVSVGIREVLKQLSYRTSLAVHVTR